jgi:hypothetical protein
MTLLTISQNIARDAKTEVPASIINNTQEIAKQILSSVKLSTKDLYERYNWEVLQYEESFNTVALTQSYSLPSDFGRIINGTFFNTTTQREIELISPREWRQFQLAANQSVFKKYRIRQNKVFLTPTPSDAEALIYEYISNEIILDTNGSTKYTDWQADTNTCLMDEDMVELGARWRFLRMQGKEYAEAQKEADDRFLLIMGRDAGRKIIYPNRLPYYRGVTSLAQEITP